MLEIIIQTDNIYVLNVISYRKEEFIIDTDKLVDRLIKYEADYNWYDLVDDYGNIEVDEEALKTLREETKTTLINSPDDILSHLNSNKEELECEDDFENNKEYQETKELIDEVEKFKEQELNDDMEM